MARITRNNNNNGKNSSSRNSSSKSSKSTKRKCSASDKSFATRLKAFGKDLLILIKSHPFRSLIAIAILIILPSIFGFISSFNQEYIPKGEYIHSEEKSDCIVIDGVDVSYAQGDVDWKELKASGVDFAFIRAGYRDTSKGELHIDDEFEKNIRKAKRAGVMVGTYYFSQAKTENEAIEEAKALIELSERYEPELPLVMDYETFEGGRLSKAISSGKLTRKKLSDNAKAFTYTVEEAGFDSAVYGNYDFLTNFIDGKALTDTTYIWTAQYNVNADFAGDYQFWQCTDSLKLSGTESEYIDRNFWYMPKNSVFKSNSTDQSQRKSVGTCYINMKKDSYRYYGKPVEPKIEVRDQDRKLRKGKEYTVSYVKNCRKGIAYALIKGIGKYKDIKAVKFEIK